MGCLTCGTLYLLPGSAPAPASAPRARVDRRRLLAQGFTVFEPNAGFALAEEPAGLVVRGAGDGTQYLAESHGQFADVDAEARFTFLEGDLKQVTAGLALRRRKPGGMLAVMLGADGTFAVLRYALSEDDAGGAVERLVPWGPHPALKPGLGLENGLRARGLGPAWTVWLNGTLAATFRDERVLQPGPVRVAFGGNGHRLAVALGGVTVTAPGPDDG